MDNGTDVHSDKCHLFCMQCLFDTGCERSVLKSPEDQYQMWLQDAIRPAVTLDSFFYSLDVINTRGL